MLSGRGVVRAVRARASMQVRIYFLNKNNKINDSKMSEKNKAHSYCKT
jgi:hypothetical protein